MGIFNLSMITSSYKYLFSISIFVLFWFTYPHWGLLRPQEQHIHGPPEGASPIRSDYIANPMGTSSEALIYQCIATREFDLKTFYSQFTTLNHLS